MHFDTNQLPIYIRERSPNFSYWPQKHTSAVSKKHLVIGDGTHPVAGDGPLALFKHSLNSLGNFRTGLGDLVDGKVLEWSGILDVGKGSLEGSLLGGDLGNGLLGGGDLYVGH